MQNATTATNRSSHASSSFTTSTGVSVGRVTFGTFGRRTFFATLVSASPRLTASSSGPQRAASSAAAMWRLREATAAARVLPVGRPTLPSGLRHGATQTPRERSKYGSGSPFGARPTTV